MERMSARPHHVGSPYDKDNAEWLLARFKELGMGRRRSKPSACSFRRRPSACSSSLEPTRFTARLEEPVVAVDPTSNQKSEQLPTYNAYSIDGDVTGPLVYVNYGRPEDYEVLERYGISGEGRHRHRALRRIVARHQAEGCGGARRDRLPDLLRIPRTTALASATCFRRARCVRPTARSAAA